MTDLYSYFVSDYILVCRLLCRISLQADDRMKAMEAVVILPHATGEVTTCWEILGPILAVMAHPIIHPHECHRQGSGAITLLLDVGKFVTEKLLPDI